MAAAPSAALAEIGERSIKLVLASCVASEREGRKSLSETSVRQISESLKRLGQDSWSKVPRIYAVLRLIDHVHILDSFIELGISDIWFPFSYESLPNCLRSPSARNKFLELQDIILTKTFDLEREDGKHQYFSKEEDVPMRRIAHLGKGGYGYVDHVISTITHKEYARKLLPRGRTFRRNTQVLKDFERELGHLKKLSHIHIVELIGSYTDLKYVGIIMSPVAEYDLKTFLASDRLSSGQLSFLRTFFGCLAAALCYLHNNQIRHKDIKPQNILVKEDKVFLTDFGISLDWSELDQSTTSGPTVKTAQYCAPEVADDMRRNTSSDVWSLGCVFLEIWTVLKGETIASLLEYLERTGSKSKCYCRNREVSITWCKNLEAKEGTQEENPPLQWICGMLQRDQDERWPAQSLCDRIQEANESEGRLTFSGMCCIEYDDHTDSVGTSKRNSQGLGETGASSIRVSYQQPTRDATRNYGTGDNLLSSQPILPPKPVTSNILDTESNLALSITQIEPRSAQQVIQSTKVDEKPQILAGHSTTVNLSNSSSHDPSPIKDALEDLRQESRLQNFWSTLTGDTAAWIATCTLEGYSGTVYSVAFSPDGQLLASGSGDGTVRLWDVATGRATRTLEGHSDWVYSVAFSPDGQLLASGSFDGTVRLWDVATGRVTRTLEGHPGWVYSVAFSPDGQLLASGSFDRTVRLWDVATGRATRTLEGHPDWVYSVAFSPDGQLLASGSFDRTVRLWDKQRR